MYEWHGTFNLLARFSLFHSIYRLDITPPDSNLVSGSFANLSKRIFCQILSRDILVSPVRLISIVTPMQEAGPGYLDRVRSNKFRAFTVGDKVNKRVVCVCTKPTRPMMNCPCSAWISPQHRLRLFATSGWQNNRETYRIDLIFFLQLFTFATKLSFRWQFSRYSLTFIDSM